jgi:hypothetical protein
VGGQSRDFETVVANFMACQVFDALRWSRYVYSLRLTTATNQNNAADIDYRDVFRYFRNSSGFKPAANNALDQFPCRLLAAWYNAISSL